MQSLHTGAPDFQATLSAWMPESLAAFLYALGAASCVMWSEGGLMVQRATTGPDKVWAPGQPSPRAELLEFFACVCGNNAGQMLHQAEPALAAFEKAVARAYPGASLHMEVEPHQRGWCSELHVLVRDTAGDSLLYLELFWSVD